MDIVNGTSDDAKVKVSGGGSGSTSGGPGSSKGRRFHEIKAPEWLVPAGQTFTPPLLPTLPLTVFFYIEEQDPRTRRSKEHEISRQVKASLRGLKLTKQGTSDYVVKPIRGPRARVRDPRGGPRRS